MQSRFHLLIQVETESLILSWLGFGFFCNLDDLSCADCTLDFKKLFWSFFRSITKVKTLSVCLQSIRAVALAALRCCCQLCAAALRLYFPSNCLPMCTCLILTSHYPPHSAIHHVRAGISPARAGLRGFFDRFSFMREFSSSRWFILKRTFMLGGRNCLLSLFLFSLSSKVAAFSLVWMWLTSFADTQQIF